MGFLLKQKNELDINSANDTAEKIVNETVEKIEAAETKSRPNSKQEKNNQTQQTETSNK